MVLLRHRFALHIVELKIYFLSFLQVDEFMVSSPNICNVIIKLVEAGSISDRCPYYMGNT